MARKGKALSGMVESKATTLDHAARKRWLAERVVSARRRVGAEDRTGTGPFLQPPTRCQLQLQRQRQRCRRMQDVCRVSQYPVVQFNV